MNREGLISNGFIEKISKTKTVYYVDSNDVVVAKCCKKCNTIKSVKSFYAQKECVGDVSVNCMTCSPRNKGLRKRNNLKSKEVDGVNTLGKTCITCDTWKPLEEFNQHRKMLAGRYSECKVCKGQKDKKYRKVNKRRVAEVMRAYQQENAERIAKRKREWLDKNPEKHAASSQRRRDRAAKLPTTITNEYKARILSIFEGCALTGRSDDVVFDHVIPIATECGGSTVENMIPLDRELNRSKSNGNLFEWFEVNKERLGMSQEKFDFLVDYLADINEMTIEEYREYYDGCFKKAD